jgi:glycosyltransferase involved in cell wall biosynthesis
MSSGEQKHTPPASSDNELQTLRRDLAHLTAQLYEIKASTGWRLLAPLHWYGRQRERIRRLLKALPYFRTKVGGWYPLISRGLNTWRQDGLIGLRARISCQIAQAQGQSVSSDTAEATAVACVSAALPCSTNPEILFVSHDASRTGAPVFFLSLIKQLKAELGISCVILLGCGGELEAEFKELGPTFIMASRMSMDPVVLHALQQRDIRLLYVNSIVNGALISALKVLQRPVLCHVHELAYSIEKIFGETNLRQTLAGTDLFLAGSQAVADYLARHISRERIALAYPFIDQVTNQRQADSQPTPLVLPPEAVVIGGCGTVGWRKGTDLFIQMARQIIGKTSCPVFFVWVGGPLSYGELSYLSYDIHQCGLNQQLIMAGSVSAHIPYLAQFDIFVLPSREDPFPLVVLDAASLGKPVVCFEQAGGAPELIEQDAGFVVPYLDVSALAAAVVQLVENSDLRQQMGACGQRKITERHDTAPGLAEIARIVQDALHSERETPP